MNKFQLNNAKNITRITQELRQNHESITEVSKAPKCLCGHSLDQHRPKCDICRESDDVGTWSFYCPFYVASPVGDSPYCLVCGYEKEVCVCLETCNAEVVEKG